MWDSFKMLATLTDDLIGVPAGAGRVAPPLLARHPRGGEEEEDEIFDDDPEDDGDLDEEDELDDDLDDEDLGEEEDL